MTEKAYSTKLQAGQGLVEETKILLDLWQSNMSAKDLYNLALKSGQFQNMTARRVKNLVSEGFASRYLLEGGKPTIYLKGLKKILPSRDFIQILLIHTCRVHTILYDFITQVYWPAYSSGRDAISIEESRKFVIQANQDRKTTSPWSDNTIIRVSGYLTGTCADFGMLEQNRGGLRKIIPFRIESSVFVYLAYDLHFSDLGDNSVISHPDWGLFGLDHTDVLNEFKRLALKGWWIVQSAGDVTRIGWKYSSMEEVIDAFAQG